MQAGWDAEAADWAQFAAMVRFAVTHEHPEPAVVGDAARLPFLTAASRRMTVERDGVRLTFHSEHRPLAAYFRALEAGGLLTEAVREVRPDDEAARQSPAVRRWQRIPLYLHLRAVKPGGR